MRHGVGKAAWHCHDHGTVRQTGLHDAGISDHGGRSADNLAQRDTAFSGCCGVGFDVGARKINFVNDTLSQKYCLSLMQFKKSFNDFSL